MPGTTAIQAGSRSRARPNAPLRKPKPWRSTSRVWTPRQLRRERDVFWETRVAGREEVWAAVRMAVELARGGGAASADVKAAQAVLDAAGVTCPTGRMGEGVWDERGVLYKLPRWVVSDPVNVGDGDAVDGAGEERVLEDVMETDEEEEEEESKEVGSEEEDAEEAGKRRDEKGKGRGRDAVKVRARLSDRGTDVVVELDREAAVRSVIRRVCELAEVSFPLATSEKPVVLVERCFELTPNDTDPTQNKSQDRLHGQDAQGKRLAHQPGLAARPRRQRPRLPMTSRCSRCLHVDL